MEQGRVLETGTHDGLMSRGGAYARLQRLQIVNDVPEERAAIRGA
jgi:subfamily B ATP-binding cassette protein MsbA